VVFAVLDHQHQPGRPGSVVRDRQRRYRRDRSHRCVQINLTGGDPLPEVVVGHDTDSGVRTHQRAGVPGQANLSRHVGDPVVGPTPHDWAGHFP
jgi:hypothetical protein